MNIPHDSVKSKVMDLSFLNNDLFVGCFQEVIEAEVKCIDTTKIFPSWSPPPL